MDHTMDRMSKASLAPPWAVAATAGRSALTEPLPPPGAAPAAAATGATLQLGIVDSGEGLAALGPEWDALFARAGGPAQVFQTHGFTTLVAHSQGLACSSAGADQRAARPGARTRLAIVVGRRRGRLVLAWPLVEQRQLGLRALTWVGEPIAQYGDVLVDPAEPVLPLLQAAYAHIHEALRPDVLRLRRVRADATVGPLLAALRIEAGERAEAPCVTLAAGGSPFEARQSGKAKKNRRRLMRRLEESGTVTFEAVSDPKAVAEVVAAGLHTKRQWLIRRGLVSPALADRRLDGFLAAALEPGAPATGAELFALRLDGRPIAVAMGFRCCGRLMLHLITNTEDAARHGAGVLNLEAVLRHAEAAGLTAVDMLPPSADYKLDWADTAVPVSDHVWGLSARGRLLVRGLDRGVRPAAKQALDALPLAARQWLARRSLSRVLK